MTADGTPGPLVLIVEDNPANLLLARRVLDRAGFRTVEAKSADEVLACLSVTTPEIILMDIQLPGRDGLSLTREIKATPGLAGVVVIALTAHAMKDDRDRMLAAGCDGYIAKPIDTRTFASEITSIATSVWTQR